MRNVELAAAPMEGLTGFAWRRVHARYFGGADTYYLPFLSPTAEPKFTPRQMRELTPTANDGLVAIPQLLTREPKNFWWAINELAEMGFREVNLNFGCPAGTVTAKNKGSGILKNLEILDDFLHKVFSYDLPIPVSVKTRIGWSSEEEFANILEIYNQYPIHRLTIHPRLKTDQYKGEPRTHVFEKFAPLAKMPLGWSGDVVEPKDIEEIITAYPNVSEVMVGRALIADPALFRKYVGGEGARKDELRAYYKDLLNSYATAFESEKNALMRMKEYWFYQLGLFEGAEKFMKPLVKSKDLAGYESILDEIFELPLRDKPERTWYKPL